MKVSDLIEPLEGMDPDADVYIHSPAFRSTDSGSTLNSRWNYKQVAEPK